MVKKRWPLFAIAQANNKITQEKLAAAQSKLQAVDAKLVRLQADKSKAEGEMATLEQTVKITVETRCNAMIDRLAGENRN